MKCVEYNTTIRYYLSMEPLLVSLQCIAYATIVSLFPVFLLESHVTCKHSSYAAPPVAKIYLTHVLPSSNSSNYINLFTTSSCRECYTGTSFIHPLVAIVEHEEREG